MKVAQHYGETKADAPLAGAHDTPIRGEAAHKLITNHEAVLRDVTNPSPSKNIIGNPLKQAELKRVNVNHAHYADQAHTAPSQETPIIKSPALVVRRSRCQGTRRS